MSKRQSIYALLLLVAVSVVFFLPFDLDAQSLEGGFITEGEWDFHKKTNWVNQLRLDLTLPLWRGARFEASTFHTGNTREHILPDYQVFSNIEADNYFASLAKLGLDQTWTHAHLFVGVRNVNEDYFTSDVTAFFTGSSPGIFPTIAASYPIANYPLAGLAIHFDARLGNWELKSSLYDGVGYRGWNRHDNPFRVDLKRDGIFNMTELNCHYGEGRYFAGFAIHNRLFPYDGEEQAGADGAEKRVTAAWYLYGEQCLWRDGERQVAVMAQYSENSNRRNGCRRYAEVGGLYSPAETHTVGLSAQYARYCFGTEWSGELTWRKELSETLAVQPAFQLIKNPNGCYPVLTARVCYNFTLFER